MRMDLIFLFIKLKKPFYSRMRKHYRYGGVVYSIVVRADAEIVGSTRQPSRAEPWADRGRPVSAYRPMSVS